MDLDELYRLMRSAHVQAQGMIDTVRYPLLVLDDQLRVVTANAAFYETFHAGREDTIGTSFLELGAGQWNVESFRLLLEKVIPHSASIDEFEITADFGTAGTRTMLVSARRLVRPDTSGRVLLLTLVDATERRRKDAESAVLLGELQHRMKNLLGLVQALVRRTEIKGRTAEEYREAIVGRIEALSRSLDLSLSGKPSALSDLVASTLEPYAQLPAAVEVDEGAEVFLTSEQALGTGMILHELSTNAAKHGALSSPGGRVRISWTVEKDGKRQDYVGLRWQESGGPAVATPTRQGFGTQMVRFAAAQDLNGQAELIYAPEGFLAELRFPLPAHPGNSDARNSPADHDRPVADGHDRRG